MISQENISLIESYLQGKLSDQDRILVEEQAEIDIDFANALDEEKILFKIIGDKDAQNFMSTVANVMSSAENSKKSTKKILSLRNIRVSIAATIVVVLGAFLLLNDKNTATGGELFSQYYKEYPLVIAQRNSSNEELNTLVSHYDQKQWALVLEDLQSIQSEYMPQPLISLYKANSYNNLNENKKSIEILEVYKNQPASPIYQDMIMWYLSLFYIKDGQVDSAREILISLEQNLAEQSGLRSNVENLLNDLRNQV